LPHNFNELCDASVAYLEGKEFNFIPIFKPVDKSTSKKYNDGERGGSVSTRYNRQTRNKRLSLEIFLLENDFKCG
jgi:topoisomerase-4 subunit A